MDREDAHALLGEWRRLIGATAPAQNVEGHLWRALMTLRPDSGVAAGITVGGVPMIVGVEGATLFEVSVALDESPASVRVQTRGVDPRKASVSLSEIIEYGSDHHSIGQSTRVRSWTIELADGNTKLEWSTRQVVAGGFEADRAVSRAERLARHLAAACGWKMPTVDATGPDWE
jgi:hypothetical protein